MKNRIIKILTLTTLTSAATTSFAAQQPNLLDIQIHGEINHVGLYLGGTNNQERGDSINGIAIVSDKFALDNNQMLGSANEGDIIGFGYSMFNYRQGFLYFIGFSETQIGTYKRSGMDFRANYRLPLSDHLIFSIGAQVRPAILATKLTGEGSGEIGLNLELEYRLYKETSITFNSNTQYISTENDGNLRSEFAPSIGFKLKF